MYGRRQEEERVPRRRLGLRDGSAHGGVAQTAEGAKAAEEAREAIKELGPERREVSCSLRTHVLVGKALRKYAAPARGLRRRGCFAEIERYLELPCPGRVLGISGIDEHIRHGGSMCPGERRCGEGATFETKATTDEYIDTAITGNIRH